MNFSFFIAHISIAEELLSFLNKFLESHVSDFIENFSMTLGLQR